MLTLTGLSGFTVIVIAFEVAGLPEGHEIFEVITQVTISPLFNAALEKVVLFVPTSEPLTFHWYAGDVPPFVGVAVKLTLVPAQIAPAGFAVIFTLTGIFGLMPLTIHHANACVLLGQGPAFEVKVQVSESPFTNEAFE
jgi:hypothetical protein